MRAIDWNNPSEEDRKWVDAYGTNGMRRKLARGVSARTAVQTAVAVEDDYDTWKTDELKKEAQDREIDLSGVKNKPQLIEKLREWDRENPE